MVKLTLPLYVMVGKKKKYANLNYYRNRHYQVSNKVKKEYETIIKSQLVSLGIGKLDTPLSITYTLFVGTKAVKDISNVLSIMDKYFSDALVEGGYIHDDNYNYITEVVYKHGGYDKNNGRVEVSILESNQNKNETT